LLAWFIGGTLVHYFGVVGAAYAGATSAAFGFLLLPLAILAKLVAFVAMFLVMREALAQLQAIAPSPPTAVERRRTFMVTLLASILPFFAIYTAWGFLKEDVDAYSQRALAIRSGLSFQAILDGSGELEGGAVVELNFSALSLSTILVAFTARWAFKRFGSRLSKWTNLLAVYFEAVWVFFSLYLISDGFAIVRTWVDSRVAMVWLGDIREWLGAWVAPLAWFWDAVGVIAGNLAGLLVQPLAWLAIAGVIYGQAIEAEKPGFQKRLADNARNRFKRVPNTVLRWLGELANEFTSRFRPIVNAVVLMWRAGPVLIASYVLLYTIVLALDPTLQWLLSRMIGPQDLNDFWRTYGPALFLLVPIVIEPLRIAVVSGAYDGTLGKLRARSDQGSTEKRMTDGIVSAEAISTQKGPSVPDGTMNGTIIS
jgi:hypothetical protein